MRLYDENDNLLTDEQILQLFDNPKSQQATVIPKIKMKKETLELLNLTDNATEEQLHDVVQQLVNNNIVLSSENKQLKDDKTKREAEDKKQRKVDAAALVDAAIKEARLNAEGREEFLQLFDKDFDAAKKLLNSIPKRKSVKGEIEKQEQVNNVELADFMSKSWDELDRSGRLVRLKDKYPDVYEQKFAEKFGNK